MASSKLTCPECHQPITTKTIKCPHCKKKVSQKYLEHYQNVISKSWFFGLGTFLLFLIIPFLLFDYLGSKWTGVVVLIGFPVSILVGYLTRKLSFNK